jgi:hypothetical protein
LGGESAVRVVGVIDNYCTNGSASWGNQTAGWRREQKAVISREFADATTAGTADVAVAAKATGVECRRRQHSADVESLQFCSPDYGPGHQRNGAGVVWGV